MEMAMNKRSSFCGSEESIRLVKECVKQERR